MSQEPTEYRSGEKERDAGLYRMMADILSGKSGGYCCISANKDNELTVVTGGEQITVLLALEAATEQIHHELEKGLPGEAPKEFAEQLAASLLESTPHLFTLPEKEFLEVMKARKRSINTPKEVRLFKLTYLLGGKKFAEKHGKS